MVERFGYWTESRHWRAVVPLDSTLRRADAPPSRLRTAEARAVAPGARRAAAARAPTSSIAAAFGEVLAQDAATRAAIRVLEAGQRRRRPHHVWDDATEHWVLLTLGEQKALWGYRGKLGAEPASR